MKIYLIRVFFFSLCFETFYFKFLSWRGGDNICWTLDFVCDWFYFFQLVLDRFESEEKIFFQDIFLIKPPHFSRHHHFLWFQKSFSVLLSWKSYNTGKSTISGFWWPPVFHRFVFCNCFCERWNICLIY